MSADPAARREIEQAGTVPPSSVPRSAAGPTSTAATRTGLEQPTLGPSLAPEQEQPASPSRRLPSGPLAPGSQLGPYQVEALLGQGAMGAVYRARHVGLDRAVALKVVLLPSPSHVERFGVEARAAARLQHPNIVTIHDVGAQDRIHYMVMDLVQGEGLDARLRREGPLEPRLAARIVRDLARALEHAHAQGILHRDLKPANVLVTEDGRPLLTDFGLAKDLRGEGGLTKTGELMGTPAFMSPEQVDSSKHVGPGADLYSLGATLHCLLTGQPPFEAEGVVPLMAKILRSPARPPSALRPGLPPALDAICLRCLAKAPDERHPNMGALAEDLDRFLAGGSEPAARRRGGVAAAVAGGVALGAVLSAALLSLARPDGGSPSESGAAVSTGSASPPGTPAGGTPAAETPTPAARPAPEPPAEVGGWEWVERSATTRPPARYASSGVFDPGVVLPGGRKGALILVGGLLQPENRADAAIWAWDPDRSTWSSVAPFHTAIHSHAVAMREDGGLVVAGGRGAAGDLFSPIGFEPAIPSGWQEVGGKRQPGVRERHAFVSAPERHGLLLYGGKRPRRTFLGDLWELTAGGWYQRALEGARPPPRESPGVTWDGPRQRLVVFGGWNETGALDDLWEWTGEGWEEVWPRRPAEMPWPEPRFEPCFVHDGRRSILFGGARKDASVLDDTWAWNGERWTRLVTSARPPGRSRPVAAWDPDRRVVVLHGGREHGGKVHLCPDDTWELRERGD